jgi:importin-9
MVKDQHPAAVQEATASIIPVWLEAFKVLLELDVSKDVNEKSWDGLAIRKELFKVSTPGAYILRWTLICWPQTLDVLNTSFPKSLKPYAHTFLSSGVSHLQALAPLFSKFYISQDPPSIPAPSDDDGQLDLMQLVCPIFDFISSTIRSGGGKLWTTTEHLGSLIEAVTWWVQITRGDVRNHSVRVLLSHRY